MSDWGRERRGGRGWGREGSDWGREGRGCSGESSIE